MTGTIARIKDMDVDDFPKFVKVFIHVISWTAISTTVLSLLLGAWKLDTRTQEFLVMEIITAIFCTILVVSFTIATVMLCVKKRTLTN